MVINAEVLMVGFVVQKEQCQSATSLLKNANSKEPRKFGKQFVPSHAEINLERDIQSSIETSPLCLDTRLH